MRSILSLIGAVRKARVHHLHYYLSLAQRVEIDWLVLKHGGSV